MADAGPPGDADAGPSGSTHNGNGGAADAGITAGRHREHAGAGVAAGTEGRRESSGGERPVARRSLADATQRLTEAGAGQALTELLSGFIAELRTAGLPVSLTENLDAMQAIQHIPLGDRSAFKYALGGDAREERRPLARVRDGLRGLLLAARSRVRADRRAGRGHGRPRRDAQRDAVGPAGRAAGRRRRRRLDDARRAGRDAHEGARPGQRGHAQGARPPGRAPLRGHGAGSPGRRHLLPVPHPAEPRPRRRAGQADAAGPRAGARAR